jgi:lantibiotic modifying enzyme
MYSYLARAFPDRDFEEIASERLNSAIDALETMPLSAMLHGGFTGIAWCVEHLRGSHHDAFDGDVNAPIDEALQSMLTISPWRGGYDLIGGLVGLGVFALERLPRAAAVQSLRSIVARLAELAEWKPEGCAWWTAPTLMPARAQLYPEGCHDLGVAHGIAGVIAFLGQVASIEALSGEAISLLEGAVRWMLAQQLPAESGFGFGYAAERREPARSAWCYGDPGIAAALLVAARAVARSDWAQIAIELGIRSTRRAFEETHVVDVGLCHGAVGLAHIYNRLYQTTGIETFAEAARDWYQRILAMRNPGEGLARYSTYERSGTGSFEWKSHCGLLTGISGIALALLAGATELEPEWDRVLLCSARDQGR